MTDGSKKAIVVASCANLGIAIARYIGDIIEPDLERVGAPIASVDPDEH